MAHEDNLTQFEDINMCSEELKTTQQKLAEANNEIENLKLQLAWEERSYE